MALALALGLYLGGNLGSGEPPTPTAPAFASEPGTLDTLTDAGVQHAFGFVLASGNPSPTYTLAFTVPANAYIIVGESQVSSPIAVDAEDVTGVSYRGTSPGDGTISVTLTASNGVGSDAVASATVNVDIAAPAPEWSPPTYAVELSESVPVTFGDALLVSNAVTIKVISLPDKGIYYIDDGDDTPLVVNDEFPLADLELLTGDADGDTGAVTGALSLRAIGPDSLTTDISVSVSIADTSVITSRTLDVERGTTVPLGLNLSNYKSGATGTLDNDAVDATVNYEDHS